jgi:hypothetical protein
MLSCITTALEQRSPSIVQLRCSVSKKFRNSRTPNELMRRMPARSRVTRPRSCVSSPKLTDSVISPYNSTTVRSGPRAVIFQFSIRYVTSLKPLVATILQCKPPDL